MTGHARYRHLRGDWVGELATESITLCGGENEGSGTERPLCPDCTYSPRCPEHLWVGPGEPTDQRQSKLPTVLPQLKMLPKSSRLPH